MIKKNGPVRKQCSRRQRMALTTHPPPRIPKHVTQHPAAPKVTGYVPTGLLGELLTRTYHEAQDKPIYAVRRVLGGPGSEAQATPATDGPREETS